MVASKATTDRVTRAAVAWCASCGGDPVEVANTWLIGRRYRCDASTLDDVHAAAIMDRRLVRWLRVQAFVLDVCQGRWHPRALFFRRLAEWYVPALALVLLLAYWLTPTRSSCVGVLLAAIVLVDTLLFNTMVAFITQNPRLAMRTVFFAVASFFVIAGAFGVFYRAVGKSSFDAPITTDLDALYFSVITLATIGYGDIHPAHGWHAATVLVVIEVAIGLYFLVGLFAIMSSWATAAPVMPTLAELLKANVKTAEQ